jgi:hypothetical protein
MGYFWSDGLGNGDGGGSCGRPGSDDMRTEESFSDIIDSRLTGLEDVEM